MGLGGKGGDRYNFLDSNQGSLPDQRNNPYSSNNQQFRAQRSGFPNQAMRQPPQSMGGRPGMGGGMGMGGPMNQGMNPGLPGMPGMGMGNSPYNMQMSGQGMGMASMYNT